MARVDDLTALADMVDDGTFTSIVGATYPLDEAGAAIAKAGSGHARGKTVITMN
jgi:NADPH:quinone reductase-like Zn-dependent oxidoreductase